MKTSHQIGTVAMDVRGALKEAMAHLRAAQVASHVLAAELLLMHTLGRDRTWLYTHPEEMLDTAAAEKYSELVARRAAGEPTQYLTGKQEFWGLEFEVTPAVLIPRPETEHVIEVSLERLGACGYRQESISGLPKTKLRIADVGTGSGCLAVALAREIPQAEIFATDISEKALEIAQRNSARHGVTERVHFLRCDLLAALHPSSQPFDLIVSNPPYLALSDTTVLPREVRDHEPHSALFGGQAGVEIYARLIEQAGALLNSGGILVVELGCNSAEHVCALLASQPSWINVKITNDLAGIARIAAVERKA